MEMRDDPMPGPSNTQLKRPDAGYSLPSVLIAVILLAVGVTSLSSVLTQSVLMQTVTSMRTNALHVAQEHMELLKSQDPITLTSETATQVDERGDADSSGPFTRTVTVAPGGRNLMILTVTVTTPRTTSPVALTTLVYDRRF